MTYPELDIYDVTHKTDHTEKQKKQIIAFEILFAYLESAFYYYQDQSDNIKRKRWNEWISYIKGYAGNENFLEAWKLTGNEWDTDFMAFMNQIIEDQTDRHKPANLINTQPPSG